MSAQSTAQTLASALKATTDLSTFNSGTQLYSSLYSSVSLGAAGSLSAHNATLPTTATALKGDTLIASASNVTLLAGAGKDSLYAAVAGDWLLPSNSGSTLVSAANASFLASASSLGGWGTMVGGGASDTLVVAGVATANDLFSKTSGIEALSLTGGSNVTLSTNAKTAGISTVFGGNGGSTLTQATGDTLATTFVGGSGNDLFSIANSTLLGYDSIFGGAGTDTLALAASATLTDSSFAKLQGIEVLSLNSTSSVVLGANAAATGIATVYGGATKNTLTQTAGDTLATTLLGGAGTDLFSVTAFQLSLDSIYGGGGKDTLALSSAGTVSDSAFAKVNGIGTLSLTSSSNVTIGTNAAAAGISLVSAGASGDTLNQTASFTAISLAGGVGNDYFALASNLVASAGESINGGTGINTLALTDSGATVLDAAFTNDKTIQALVLGSNSSVVLDAKAKGAGIASVFGASGGSTISQTAGDTNVTTIVGGSGNDSIAITSGVLTKTSAASNDSIIGGGGVDTLSFNDTKAAAIADTAFSRVKGMSVLALNGDSLTVGANARSAGFSTIIAGATGSITHTVADTNALTLIGGSANGSTLGNAFFESTSAVLAADSIAGGAGTDTLVISSQGIFNDASFSRVRGVEVLSLTGASQINAGSALKAAGINTVLGGSGGDTFTQATGDVFTLNGGAGADSFEVSTTALRADSIAGGSGTDTLALTSNGTIADSDFAKVSGVEVLQLTSSSTVNLDANAAAAGIKTIYAGNGGDVINQTASLSGAATIIGGSGNDLVSVATQAIFVADSLYGGKGVDTLVIADSAATIADANFAKAKGFEVLSLNGGTATLGAGAAAEGFTTIKIAGGAGQVLNASAFNGDQHIIDDTASTGADSILGSVNTGTKFIVNEANLASSTFVGGSGADTVALTAGQTLSDSDFANLRNMNVLSLIGAGSSVTIDSTAGASGINSIYGGTGAATISQTAGDTLANYINGSANTSGVGDLYTFDNAGLVNNDTVIGSGGVGALSDTLQIIFDQTGSGTFGDAQFSQLSHVSGVGALQLDDAANDFGNPSTVILGSSANSSGFTTIVGAVGNDTFAESAGSWKGYYLDGASQGNGNLFSLASGAQMQANTLIGSGTDTLQVAGNVVDANFTNTASTGVNVVQLTGSASITVGAYADDFFQNNSSNASGVGTISGGTGNDTFTQSPDSNNAYFFDGSNGSKNLYVLNNVNLLASNGGDTINGAGAGRGDTLSIAQTDITDANIANVSGVDALQLNGSSDVTLGAAANNNYNNNVGFSSIFGGAGSSTITQDATNSAPYYLSGVAETSQIAAAVGAGNLFVFDNAGQLGNDTVVGGGGSDTIQINTNSYGEITDSTFNSVQNIPLLQLNGGQVVDLGTAAYSSGLVSIEGGAGSDTFNQYFNSTKGYYLDGSANTSTTGNLFSIDTASEVAADTIVGGSGIDTLQININSGAIADSSFSNVTNVPVLQLTGNASVVIGYNADAAGLMTISGGTGNDTFTQDYSSGNNYYLDGSNDTSAIGGNLFVLDNSYMVAYDTIMGGSGVDTLQISNNSQGEITDSTFANVSNITVLSLAGGANIDLGANTDNMNLSTINGGNGDDTFNQQAASSNAYYMDGSHDTTGSGNLFEFDNSAQVAIDTIKGGSGYDTIQINNNSGGEITDSTFANVNKVSVLQLNGNQTVDLGSAAYSAGLVSIVGGAGDVIFNQSSNSAKSYYLDGSADPAGGGNLFSIDNAREVAADTIIGGSGIDTLQININSGVIADSTFVNVTNVKTLQLTGGASVVIGSNADNAGFVSLEGGSGNDTILQDSTSVNNYYLDGSNNLSSSGGNLFILDNSSQLYSNKNQPGDTIQGGAGKDTLAINNNAYGVINDSAFTNVSSISVLSLSAGAIVDLGVNTDNAGIMTVSGGSGDSTLLQDSTSNNAYYLDGSQDTSTLAGNVFTIDNAAQLSNDTIRGGSGTDTLQVGNGYGTVTDSSFVQVRNVDVLQLANNGSVILGTNADLAGFGTIAGGSGDAIFTQSAASTNHFYLDGSNDTSTLGGNLFAFDNAAQLSNDTIAGGSGIDTLQLNSAGSVTDSAFNNVNGVSLLQLTGSSSVSLGSAAQNAGIISVSGGAGTNTLSAAGYTAGILLDNSYATGNSSILGGSGADTLYAGAGTDTLQGYAVSTTNATSDTLSAGSGADLFILGDTTANAYGNGGVALIQNFSASDTLQLHDYSGTGSDASDYSLVSGSWGSGASAYNEQLFDISNSGTKLIANINYTGSDAPNDILGQSHFVHV